MSNLDQAIAAWRRQMQAAGIKVPELLDELESHLREDVEHRMRQGSTAQGAFEVAIRNMGKIDLLKAEFDKCGDFFSWLGCSKSTRTDRILGLLWLAGCSWSFSTMCRRCITARSLATSTDMRLFLLDLLIAVIYLVGMFGSVLLLQGADWGHRIVRMLALLMLIACAAQIFDFEMITSWRVWCGCVAAFSLGSIVLLYRPSHTDQRPDAAAE